MTTLTITAKGQITLRKELLQHLGIEQGDKIVADKLPDGRVLLHARGADGSISDFVGSLAGHSRASLSIEQISELTADAWADKR